jgi:hypothetical protein
MGSIPVRVTRNQSTIGGLIFIYFPRESMEAEVNDVSVTRQSRAPARPQARIPVQVTKIKKSRNLNDYGIIIIWSRVRESNPPSQLGKLE